MLKKQNKQSKKTSELPDGFEGRVFVPFFFLYIYLIWVHQVLVEARGIFIAAWELSHHA